MSELEEQPALEEMCVCLHDYGTHTARGKHRCTDCSCHQFRKRPARKEKPAKGPDVVFVDGPDGEAVPIEPTGEDR